MGRFANTSTYSQEEITLWEKIKSFQGETFTTVKGLPFTYSIKGNELFVSRRSKSITRSTVNQAYKKAMTEPVNGPKQLGVFGGSYLYPVFSALELLKNE